jgi:16S rRNA C967 or C1407 C5-methylase (RsmB/RsmF family)
VKEENDSDTSDIKKNNENNNINLNKNIEKKKSKRQIQEAKRKAKAAEGDHGGHPKGFPPESFDRILLDPPCSGLGNRPRLKDTQSMKTLEGHAAYQRKLVHTAIPLLKPGGVLVYSTCTISPLENEEMVAYILKTFPEMCLVPPPDPYCLGLEGLATSSLGDEQRKCVQRFDPRVMPEMTGFFIAKFVKQKK